MTELYTLCPYCGDTLPAQEAVCPSCHEDLAGLISLEKRHLLLYNEAVDAARAGDLDGATLALRMCLRAREDFAPALKLLAKVYARAANWRLAREAAHRAEELLPGDPALSDLLAEIDRAEAAELTKRRIRAQEVALDRRTTAEEYLEAEQRDVVAAFGAGAALVAIFVFIVALLRGGRD